MERSPRTWKTWRSSAPFAMELGGTLPELVMAYETWGELAPAGGNVVVILHALSGSSHALSSPGDPIPGWWDALFAPGAPLGRDRHLIVCCNLLGGCYGSTGPSSPAPDTGRPWGLRFPQLTIGDTIESVRLLLRGLDLGPERAGRVTLIGGSMGGMLVLDWGARHPGEIDCGIALCTPGRSYAQTIAFRSVQRNAIMSDPAWRGGDYAPDAPPAAGLALARQIGMITYRSDREFARRFGREVKDDRPSFTEGLFQVQSYLEYQGSKFVGRFDANTYLYYSRAMDLFDLADHGASFEDGVLRIGCPLLLISFTSDFLCPAYQTEEVAKILDDAGRPVRYVDIETDHGHDAFLIETETINAAIEERPRAR